MTGEQPEGGWVICQKPVKQAAAVVFDSPHSGTVYPEDFRYACPKALLQETEDSFVDMLFGEAPARGLPLIKAVFPRCYIDPNRAADDIDPLLLEKPWPGLSNPSSRSDVGTGLIRRLVKTHNPQAIYDRFLDPAEIQNRLERCYLPYHRALETQLDDTFRQFGAVWHLNCHSMPLAGFSSARSMPDMVLGDRDGTTCAPGFTKHVAACLKQMGYRVALNRPYKGVELVRRYADPARNRHSLQIEIRRSLYMDEVARTKTAGFETTRLNMTYLIDQIAVFAAKNAHAAAPSAARNGA